MLPALALRTDSSSAGTVASECTTVCTVKMLESDVQVMVVCIRHPNNFFTDSFLMTKVLHAPKEPSDCKEALPLRDVWRSATAMPGAQCAMTSGALLMPKLPAGSWDLAQQVVEDCSQLL